MSMEVDMSSAGISRCDSICKDYGDVTLLVAVADLISYDRASLCKLLGQATFLVSFSENSGVVRWCLGFLSFCLMKNAFAYHYENFGYDFPDRWFESFS